MIDAAASSQSKMSITANVGRRRRRDGSSSPRLFFVTSVLPSPARARYSRRSSAIVVAAVTLLLLVGSSAAASQSSVTGLAPVRDDNGDENSSMGPSVDWWPSWGGGGGSDGNSSDGGVGSGSGSNSSLWEQCNSHDTCNDCTASWGCHWCGGESTCNAKGSPHGCTIGASCDADDGKDNNEVPDNSGSDGNSTDNDNSDSGNSDDGKSDSGKSDSGNSDGGNSDSGNNDGGDSGGDDSGGGSKRKSSLWEHCDSHENCGDCTSAYGCHWCGGENTCNAKASPYGCTIGTSCDADNNNEAPDNSCATHGDCSSCAASSWGCHWCSHDNACHAVGSIHGCAAGVDCYAIERCQRLEPEHVDNNMFSGSTYTGAGTVAKVTIGIIAGLVACCATACLASATLVKSAVDDLVETPREEGGRSSYDGEQDAGGPRNEREELEFALLPPSTNEYPGADYRHRIRNGEEDVERIEEEEGRRPEWGAEEEEDEEESESEGGVLAEIHTDNKMVPYTGDAVSSMVDSQSRSWSYYSRSPHQRQASPPPPPRRAKHVHRMYGACRLCYFSTLAITVVLSLVALSYAPRKPVYNVCTDQLAWKSIVEGMASLKMSASFDLLVSVFNPNRLEVDLDGGSGKFHHDGQYVGSFVIPPSKVAPRAISDLVLKVTFTPDKWAALSLTAEYYEGTLAFDIDGHSNVLIPGLGNYAFDAKFEDIKVNVNDPALDDTHLCACPGWKKPGSGGGEEPPPKKGHRSKTHGKAEAEIEGMGGGRMRYFSSG